MEVIGESTEILPDGFLPPVASIPSDGLLAFYEFDGNGTDSSETVIISVQMALQFGVGALIGDLLLQILSIIPLKMMMPKNI